MDRVKKKLGEIKSVNVFSGQIVVIPLLVHSELTVIGEHSPVIIRATPVDGSPFDKQALQRKIERWQQELIMRKSAIRYVSILAAAMAEGMIFCVSPKPEDNEPFFYAISIQIEKNVDPLILQKRQQALDNWASGKAEIVL